MKNLFFSKTLLLTWLVALPVSLLAQSLNIPFSTYGLSIGNSVNFTGIRLNWADHEVQQVSGLNMTLWYSKDNDEAEINGISLGLISPQGRELNGIQVGGIGVAAEHSLNGLSLALIGVGSGGDASGINFGGIGVGAGGDLFGLNIGGIGVGAGGNVTGLNIGGIGVGSGGKLTGINVGVFGVGASGDITGINFGGFGLGSGGNITGLNVGLFGLGAAGQIKGISVGGIGLGAGEKISGFSMALIGVGSPEITGITLTPGVAGAEKMKGLTVALANLRIRESFSGVSLSAYNDIRGKQTGLAIGIVNRADELKGVQLGLINYVRSNPGIRKVLPILNFDF